MTNDRFPGPEAEAALRERADSLAQLGIEGKEEKLFEFDILLRGLDRFFNLENLFLKGHEHIARRDFAEEMTIVLQLLKRLEKLSRVLLHESDKNAYHFQRYVEAELADDFLRDLLLKKSQAQEGPRESLYVLLGYLTNIHVIVDSLVANAPVSFAVFKAVGELLRCEMMRNRFFNPLQSSFFSPTYDRVSNRSIARIVNGIEHAGFQRRFSFVLLVYFRLLHYLQLINPRSRERDYLKSCLLIFSLIRSEGRAFLGYLDKGFRDGLFDGEGELLPDEDGAAPAPKQVQEAAQVLVEIDCLSHQMEMELRKVGTEELGNVRPSTGKLQLRAVVENAHGILTNLFQQAVVALARVFSCDLKGEDVFPLFESRRHQSQRLLEDVAIFLEILDHFDERIGPEANAENHDLLAAYLLCLKRFLNHFKRETFMLLRYNDLTEFGEFFKIVNLLSVEDLGQPGVAAEFLGRTKSFRIFVQATIVQIGHRQDLGGNEPSPEHIKDRLRAFLLAETKPPQPIEHVSAA